MPLLYGETGARYADGRIAYQVNAPAQFSDRATWLLDRGAAAWSQHQGAWYYEPDDTGTPDGVTRAAAVGGGNWVRSGLGRPGATTTAHYYVDPTLGDDANDGLVAGTGHSLASPDEALRRIGRQEIATNNITVHLATSYTPALSINVFTSNLWTLNFRGTRTTLASYLLSARTAWAAGTIGDYTLTGAPNLTSLGYANARHATVRGGNLQSPIGVDKGSGKFCGNFFDIGTFTRGEPVAAVDTLDMYSFPKLGGDVHVSNYGNGYVQFSDLDVGNVGAPHSVQCMFGSTWFVGCNVRGLDFFEGITLGVLEACQTFDCRSYSALQIYTSICNTSGGAALAARGRGNVQILGPTVVQGDGITAGHSQEGPGDFAVNDWLAVADYPSAAATVYPGSIVHSSAKMWATSSLVSPAAVGYRVYGGGAIRYASGLAPSLAGTMPTADTIIGGSTVALGALPSLTAANGACIVVDA